MSVVSATTLPALPGATLARRIEPATGAPRTQPEPPHRPGLPWLRKGLIVDLRA